jgi:hypothetical protein
MPSGVNVKNWDASFAIQRLIRNLIRQKFSDYFFLNQFVTAAAEVGS